MGSKGCRKKRCEVCVNVCETDTFSGTVTGERFKINQKLNCDVKSLIYLFVCECSRNQYVGETTWERRFRWNNYKCNDRKYNRNENFLGNVKISVINKNDGQNPKKTED